MLMMQANSITIV